MMHCLALSDLHGYLPDIPKCDLLLLGGDYAHIRDSEMQRKFFLGRFRDWLTEIPARHIVGIAGNHDLLFEKEPDVPKSLPWVYLQDELTIIEDVRIYGTPWTNKFHDWAFMLPTEDALRGKFAGVPYELDILLSHGPAYRHLDQTVDGSYVGSFALLEAIRETKPDSVVCGHIHEARGVSEDWATRYYNVSHVNVGMQPKFDATIVQLKA